MKVLHFKDSYNIWSPQKMLQMMQDKCGNASIKETLNRTLTGLYVEWWLHNIGYYITKPFPKLKSYNLRFKDVDLEERCR